MEAYTYKCPGCGAALEYDPTANLLVCNSCGQLYPVQSQEPITSNEISTDEIPEIQNSIVSTSNPESDITAASNDSTGAYEEYMEMNIYHCSSCGAEVMTTDVEVSKFCSYCGQPTIMFDRVSREKRPNKILPFGITKDQALAKAKAKFAGGKFLADAIDNVTVDSVYGIYMPYWVYDSTMTQDVRITYRVDKSMRVHETRESKRLFVPLDASERFSDYTSLLLNPYPLHAAVDFDTAYLSGFYADAGDVDSRNRIEDVREFMSRELKKTVINSIPNGPSAEVLENFIEVYEKTGSWRYEVMHEDFGIYNCSYVFLPVYFVTFRVKNEPVIILVNGCNGKVVGSVPIDEVKFAKQQRADIIFHVILYAAIGAVLFGFMPIIWSSMLLLILVGSLVLSGSKAKKKYETLLEKTNSASMFSLSKDRER